MFIYTGSNDVLHWYYSSQQESKGKTGIYLGIFGIFTFLFSTFVTAFILVIDFGVMPA